MGRLLLVLEHQENRRLLEEWLASRYEVAVADSPSSLEENFDLGILDGRSLDALEEQVLERRRTEEPVFLPFLLLTSRHDVKMVTRHLWKTIDEIVLTPVEKVELMARVEILLRARNLSIELAETTDRLRQILENPLVGVYEADATGRFTFINERLAQMYGGSPEEVVGKLNMMDVIAPEFRDTLTRRLATRRAGHEWADLVEVQLLRKDGTRFDALVAPAGSYRPDGRLRGFVGMVIDISQRKQMERQIQQRFEDQRRLLRLMAGREVRMAELKEVIQRLRQQLIDAGLQPVADDPLRLEDSEESP